MIGGYTSGQLNSSASNVIANQVFVVLTWEPNLFRYQSSDILPPLDRLCVVEFLGMHVVNLAFSVNDPPRVRRPKRRVSVSPWEAQFRLHNWSRRSARSREKSVNGEMLCPRWRVWRRAVGRDARREIDHHGGSRPQTQLKGVHPQRGLSNILSILYG